MTGEQVPQRPPLVRPQEDRWLGGVAAGVAHHLGVPVGAVRGALVLAAGLGGAGVVVYVWLWALVPSAAEPPPDPAGHRPSARPESSARVLLRARGANDLIAGATLLLCGGYLLLVRLGHGWEPGIVVPLFVIAAGTAVAFTQLDEVERARWAERAGVGTRVAALRVIGGGALVVVGLLLLVLQGSNDVAQLGQTLLAAVAVLGGAGLVLAPWGLRLWRGMDLERAARVREAERADIAAHLHDSVLQTLALIQRRSSDSAEVARLARAQERDLRNWLYGGAASVSASVSAAVTDIAADAEDLHSVVVDVVTVGDRPVDERLAPLLAALREAVSNAARHAGGTIRVYVECGPDGVSAFVRDRGAGFDPDSAPADRLGVRESIIGRMERHGGSAEIRSSAEGTEVRLALPDRVTPETPEAP